MGKGTIRSSRMPLSVCPAEREVADTQRAKWPRGEGRAEVLVAGRGPCGGPQDGVSAGRGA